MSEELGKRAVDCKHWRWMPGMLTEGWRLVCVSFHDGTWSAISTLTHREYHYPTLPDLTDPATLGCLLALVREAHKDAYMTIGCVDGDWIVTDCDGREVSRARSESEALVAALEAAE